jgi:hypothetical protein
MHLIKRESLGVLDALDIAVECVLDRRAHFDNAFWSRHLHLEVGVVRDRHELGIAQTPEDGVVHAPKSHHLKDEGLLAEVVWRAKLDRQVDLSKGLEALAWRNAVERCRAGPQLVQADPHQL